MTPQNADHPLSDSDEELPTGPQKSDGEAYAMNMRSIAVTREFLEQIDSVRTSFRAFFPQVTYRGIGLQGGQ